LHHYATEIFDRREDALTGVHTIVNAGQVTLTTDLSGNPSRRRDAVQIHFTCETCCAFLTLQLAQHKGQSLIWWQDRHPASVCGSNCTRVSQAVSAVGW
jgi:hypothetical protein